MSIQVLLGLSIVLLASFVLGFYLGFKGFIYIFTNADISLRFSLSLIALIPALIVLWLQESHGYSASPLHIGLNLSVFSGAFIIGYFFRTK